MPVIFIPFKHIDWWKKEKENNEGIGMQLLGGIMRS